MHMKLFTSINDLEEGRMSYMSSFWGKSKRIWCVVLSIMLLIAGITLPKETVYADDRTQEVDALVERFYRLVLGRTADSDGLRDWSDSLLDHTRNVEEVINGFINSYEYHTVEQSLTNGEKIDNAYTILLNSTPSQEDKNYLQGLMDSGDIGSYDVFYYVAKKDEFVQWCDSVNIETGLVTIDSLSVNEKNITLLEGEVRTIKSNASVISGYFGPHWESSDETIATITSDGTVEALAAGTVTITCSYENQTDTCEVEIKPFNLAVHELTVPVNQLRMMSMANSQIGNTYNPRIFWSSSNSSIASVDSNGRVTGNMVGKAIITATYGRKTDTCEVTITNPLDRITLSNYSLTIKEDETKTISVGYEPEDTTDNKDVVWSTSNTEIATVSDGVIRGISPGSAQIIANVGGKTATCSVNVTANGSEANANAIDVGTEVEGTLYSSSDSDYYKIEIEQPGSLAVELKSKQGDQQAAGAMLISETGNTLYYDSLSMTPVNTREIGLKAGVYYIKIYSRGISQYPFSYILKTTYSNSSRWEEEPNASLETATMFPPEQEISGSFVNEHDVDYYKFTVDKTAYISLNGDAEVTILTNDEKTLYTGNLTYSYTEYTNSNGNLRTTSKPFRVSPGIYYVKAVPTCSYRSVYKIKVTYEKPKWMLISYSYRYSSRGYDNQSKIQLVVDGEYPIRPTDPTCEGYTFGGWYWSSNPNKPYNFDAPLTDNLTIREKWIPVNYAIEYDYKGGSLPSGLANPATYNIETSTFALTNPTRDGYEFVGWIGTDVPEASKNVVVNKGSMGGRKYTATWTKLPENTSSQTESQTNGTTQEQTSTQPEVKEQPASQTEPQPNSSEQQVKPEESQSAQEEPSAQQSTTPQENPSSAEVDTGNVIAAQPKDPVQVNNFVERMYSEVLKRSSDPAGKEDWSSQLLNGKSDGASLAYGFICSAEFTNQNVSDEEFVDTLYHTFFNREPDEGGRAGWLQELANGRARTGVLSGFVNSVEFGGLCDEFGIARGTMEEDGSSVFNEGVRNFVLRNYTQILGRNGETAGIEDWSYRINHNEQSMKDVAISFLHSQEFLDKNLSNEEYVKVLYRAFLGREPDPAGLADWVGKLDRQEATRDDIVSGFSDSKEFENIMAQYQ